MASIHPSPHTDYLQADTRMERQLTDFWQRRISDMLERLEREARRMFQLEAELSQFAADYYDTVGAATERLAEVEQRLQQKLPVEPMAETMPALAVNRDAAETRRAELKERYRNLAKEIHPDRVKTLPQAARPTIEMQALNTAYQHGDLAAILKLEAETLVSGVVLEKLSDTRAIEQALRDLERAAETYAEGYRTMLNSPLNELMLRAMSARLAGWDWLDAVVKKVERTIEEKERAAALAGIAQISAWRETVEAA